MTFKALHLFCGLGGGALGFQRAGFEGVGAFDFDQAACDDFELLTGEKATQADLGAMTPDELRAACTGRPDVVFTSPPCKGNSGCLPEAQAASPKYQAMNSLAMRSIFLVLEAWKSNPPGLILLENVPRITTRSREWLDQIIKLLQQYGYAVRETTHDCGELGGLAQRRRRYLLVARHMATVPEFLYQPPKKPLLGIGEVLGKLPVPLPGSTLGGPMHSLPKLSPLNWVRLALIRAGGDWRDIPRRVALAARAGRQNGGFGVEGWADPAHSVLAEGSVRNTRASVADPRLPMHKGRYRGKYGNEDWNAASHTVMATASPELGRGAVVSDPRVTCLRREGSLGVKSWDGVSAPVIAHGTHHNWPAGIADPRLQCAPRSTAYGVAGSGGPAGTVLGAACHDNGAFSYADPRVTHPTRKGNLGVAGWFTPSHTIIGDARTYKGANVADPRDGFDLVEGPGLTVDEDGRTILLDGSSRPCHLIIRAEDGTVHRPMTTLELFHLQGFGEYVPADVVLTGKSHRGWRGRIGNAVPPPAAEAIAREMLKTLEASRSCGLLLSGQPVWVEPAEAQAA